MSPRAAERRHGRAAPSAGLRLRFGTSAWLTARSRAPTCSLIVLIPLAAVVWQVHHMGVGEFWDAVTDPQAVAALKLTLVASLIVVGINAVFGTIDRLGAGPRRLPRQAPRRRRSSTCRSRCRRSSPA